MRSALRVYLYGLAVGEVIRLDDGRVIFDFDDHYVHDANRLVLSQSFEKEDGGVRTPTRAAAEGQVPPFFSNLLPEGALRAYLARVADVSEHREFELLDLLGSDLPGAVWVRREDGSKDFTRSGVEQNAKSKPLRFSLAGVQLKFSAIERQTGGLTIPAHGIGGDWIVKLPSTHYPRVPENEYSAMSMAGRVGIDIPEIKMVPIVDIEGLPPEVLGLEESEALVVRRFDRLEGGRIHIEDFAQAMEQRPSDKYTSTINYTDLAMLISNTCDEDDVIDFSKRLMFSAIIGNGDMHLKNWSFIYPDGRTAKLSPAYDFLCTTVYISNDDAALKLGSTRKWQELTLDDFASVAERASVDRQTFVDAAVDTAVRFRDCWEDCVKSLPVDEQLKQSIEFQMANCPAIRSSLRRNNPIKLRTPTSDRD